MTDPSSSLSLLVIEDDADTRTNLDDILQIDAHRVETAATAAEAFRPRDWARLDAIILDRRLPDGVADDLLPRFKELAPEAAMIIVTGFADVEGAIMALRRGASDYILKPINADALRASLDRIAQRKRAERELKTRVEQQAVVAEIGRLALQSADVARLMDEAVARIAATLHVGFCMVLELLPDESALLLRAGVGWREGLVGLATVDAGPDSQAGHMLRTGAPVVVDGRADMPSFSAPALLRQHGVVSGISVVIHGERRPFGILGAHATQPRTFTKSDVDFLQAIANVLAAALERLKTEERVRHAERLAAIGQMVTGLAHESRNALQRSQACLELLGLELEDRPQALQLLARIQRAQDHLHHLYEEVRGYAAPIHLRRRMCDLGAVIRETWSHLELARRGRDVRLIEKIAGSDLACAADRHALEQVFRNVLENAISASPEAGEIVVCCRGAELDGQAALQIVFRDQGPGLAPEQQARIFEPFYTTKTQGTGLGMAIAKRIVEAHGGRIRVGNAVPGGAEIVITLPRGSL